MHSDRVAPSLPSSRRWRPRTRRSRRGATVGAAAVVAAVLLVGSCASEADDDAGSAIDPATAGVEYRFNDSSVPPEYHRSYTITVEGGDARMVVDSYGDELHDVTEPVPDEVWTDLLDRADGLSVDGTGSPGGCSGGTSRELQVTDAEHPADDPAVRVRAERCGSDGEHEAEAVEAVIEPVLALFDTETLLATG